MIGMTFHMGGNPQKLLLAHPYRLYFCYTEHTFRQCSRLIKNKSVCLCQILQIITAFYHNTVPCRRRDSSQKRNWHRHHKSCRTCNDQEDQSTVDPGVPVSI